MYVRPYMYHGRIREIRQFQEMPERDVPVSNNLAASQSIQPHLSQLPSCQLAAGARLSQRPFVMEDFVSLQTEEEGPETAARTQMLIGPLFVSEDHISHFFNL